MRLIDADEVFCSDCEWKDQCENVVCDVKTMPTIDPESLRVQWISVEDRLPQEWEEVLVRSECNFTECAVYLGTPGKWRVTWNHDMLEPDSITHWMPLPEPPNCGAKMKGSDKNA